MWKRSDLKAKAKGAFKATYWKSVLVGLVISFIVGGGAVASASLRGAAGGRASHEVTEESAIITVDEIDDDGNVPFIILDSDGGSVAAVGQDGTEHIPAPVATLLALVALAVFAVALLATAFVINPLEVGCRRFFVHNLNRSAEVKELAFPFDHAYLQTVKTMVIRDLRLIGWTLLFIIPGLVKAYEYSMVPYLISEDPELTTAEAFAESRRLMNGNKWRAFVLDLSFLGWSLLSALTLGILGLFYVIPYRSQTSAALYEALRYGDGTPDFAELPDAGMVAPAAAPDAPALSEE